MQKQKDVREGSSLSRKTLNFFLVAFSVGTIGGLMYLQTENKILTRNTQNIEETKKQLSKEQVDLVRQIEALQKKKDKLEKTEVSTSDSEKLWKERTTRFAKDILLYTPVSKSIEETHKEKKKLEEFATKQVVESALENVSDMAYKSYQGGASFPPALQNVQVLSGVNGDNRVSYLVFIDVTYEIGKEQTKAKYTYQFTLNDEGTEISEYNFLGVTSLPQSDVTDPDKEE